MLFEVSICVCTDCSVKLVYLPCCSSYSTHVDFTRQAVDETDSGVLLRNETLQFIDTRIECNEEVLAGDGAQDFLLLVDRVDHSAQPRIVHPALLSAAARNGSKQGTSMTRCPENATSGKQQGGFGCGGE